MTTGKNWASAGLVFLGSKDIDIVEISNRVGTACESLNQIVTGVKVLADDSSLVTSQHCQIWVTTLKDHPVASLNTPAAVFLSVRIAPRYTKQADKLRNKEWILAHVLSALNRVLSADYIQWIEQDTILSSADFMSATAQPDTLPLPDSVDDLSAKPAAAHSWPTIEETNAILQSRLAQCEVRDAGGAAQGALRAIFTQDPDTLGQQAPNPVDEIREKTAPLRLSVWMISFTIALFCLPVGAALIAFNLLRGENLRLSSQTAALTGTFISLQSYGTTAQAMNAINGIIG